MGFNKKTIRDINLTGKTVLVRADYNVPVQAGKITDDYRILQSLPTIKYLLKHDAKVVICSHLGRPESKNDPACSLRPVATRLGELLGKEVAFAADCIGPEAETAAKALQPGQVLLLENVRYYRQEEANDKEFAAKLAGLADVFVQDGFGVVHRAHATTDAVARQMPSVAGLLLEREVATITKVMEEPKRPLMAIIGGAKITDKIEILKRFIGIADFVAVGGAMANTFLLAEGIATGKSLTEPDEIHLAREIVDLARAEARKRHFVFYLPQDGVVAKKMDSRTQTRIVDWDAQVIADIQNYPKQPDGTASRVADDEMILDIGPFSASFIAGGMQLVNTVIWNGTMGVTETKALNDPTGPFAHGTEIIIESLLGQFGRRPFSLVGGGDTVGYIQQRGLADMFNHVSTGGGASLELMSGKKLPGVEALQDA